MAEPGWEITRLEWDSVFWGREVATARPASGAPPLDASRLDESGFDLVYALCSTGDLAEVRAAEDAGCRAVDLRCVVVGPARPGERPTGHALAPSVAVSVADDESVEQAAELAGSVHTNTRFANDPHLERDRVRELYRRWIARDAGAPGWQVLVARDGRVVDGYVTHGPGVDGTGTIGLIGVRDGARGRGLGRNLLAAALAVHAAAGRSLVRVVTHGGDAASMSMYQAAGFTVESLQVWLHWHRPR